MKLKPLVGKHIGPKNIDKTRSQPNYPSQASSENNLLFFLMVESSYQTKGMQKLRSNHYATLMILLRMDIQRKRCTQIPILEILLAETPMRCA